MDSFPRRTREVVSGVYHSNILGKPVIVLEEKPNLAEGQEVEITVEVTVIVKPV